MRKTLSQLKVDMQPLYKKYLAESWPDLLSKRLRIPSGSAVHITLGKVQRLWASMSAHRTSVATHPTRSTLDNTQLNDGLAHHVFQLHCRLLQQTLCKSLAEAKLNQTLVAVIVISMNDLHAGSYALSPSEYQLLRYDIEERLRFSLQASDKLFHTAAHEYTIVLTELINTSEIALVRRQLSMVLHDLIKEHIPHWQGEMCWGLAHAPAHANTAVTLIKYAQTDLHTQSRTKQWPTQALKMPLARLARDTHATAQTPLFNLSAMTNNHLMNIHTHSLVNDLQHAITQQQLSLHYQPIVDAATRRIYKAEALLRWTHPTLGSIPPTTFIPLAEAHGMIQAIGDWVFFQAALQAKHWQQSLDPAFQISINKSPLEFQYQNLAPEDDWLTMLKELGVANGSIAIEITEGIFMEGHEHVTKALKKLRDAGIQIFIDDFGIGYSSLAYLKKFAVDMIKIDKFFINDITKQNVDSSICEAMITMAHRLELQVVAEGVESEAQNHLLQQLGCDYIQGYFVSRPLPEHEFEAFYHQYHRIYSREKQQA